MRYQALLGVLALAAALLNCNSTVNEGPRATGSLQPLPNLGSGTEARLNGLHVKTLQLLKGEVGEGLSLQFQAGGMSGVRQFEFTLALEPAEAFDLNSASFAPAKPFITMGSGVQIIPEKTLRLGGAYLDASGYTGDGELGTLHLKTRSSQARIRILRFSVGPSSSKRDTYTEQQLNLGLNLGP
ncbi:MAG: hypothetical protein FJY95_07565 [Candidatus Handelsmanbacteria bacterium]|nr:hypothetical protein [Candidatus Handelsmanbacteria bacterium]